MKILLLLFLHLLFIPFVSSAQNYTQTVKGTVLEKGIKNPLIGATVVAVLPETSESRVIGAVTDLNGHFRLTNVPVGKIGIQVTYLGYKDAVLSNITVNSGKEVDLTIEMEEALIKAGEVVITAKVAKQKALNELATVSARTFSVEETQRFAAAVNDPARMASSYAGVVMRDDGNNTILIRGNAPNGLLWRMEGVDIPNPNHFSNVGSSGGGISILSAQLLSNSDFMTGAFPSEYGNALSGVFDLKLRKGNMDKYEYTLQAGVLGIDAAAEGPMRIGNQTGSFLANYRYSTLSVLSKLGVMASGTENGYEEDEFMPDYMKRRNYEQQHRQLKYTLSTVLNHKFNARHFLRSGAYVNFLDFNFKQSEWDLSENYLRREIQTTGQTQTLNAFAQWQYRPAERLTMNAGLHSMVFFLNNSYSVEPRASVKYAFSEQSSLSLGYGLHAQIQPLGVYFTQLENGQINRNRDLNPTKAHHLVLSYDRVLPGNLHLKTEAYFQHLYDVPVSSSGPTSFSMLNMIDGFESESLVNQGNGRNFGFELTFEKFLTRGLYFLLSSSVYEAKYQGSDGIWRDTRYNGNYANTFTAGKEWDWNKSRKNRSVAFNLKLVHAGGYRDTPVDLEASKAEGRTVRYESRAFESKMPDYFRLDVGARLKRNYANITTTVGIDLQNASNRLNVYNRYYDPNSKSIEYGRQTGLIPVLFYKVEF
ncbi:MAG: TonB-dependent receptor [Lewinellaceae bacterium]|nr:TonB-dependent receptor [Lewinellaceae bacterium]